MRYPLVLGIAAFGLAVVRFFWKRPAIPPIEEAHSPGEILLQKQEGLSAAATGKPVVPVTEVKPADVETNGEKIQALIARTAYFLAKQRGFVPGREAEDWIVAEAMVKAGMATPA